MAEFSVKLSGLNSVEADLKSVSKTLGNLASSVERITRQIDFEIKCKSQIQSNLKKISSGVSKKSVNVNNMAAAVGKCAVQYKDSERNICETANGEYTTRDKIEDTIDNLWKMLSKFGIGGSAVNTLKELFGEGDILGGLKGLSDVIYKVSQGVVKVGKGDATWAQMIFGTNKLSPKSFIDNLGEQFRKYCNFDGAGNTISTVAKWAGAVVSGVSNWLDNLDEGNTTGRVLGETVVETAYDVVLGTALYAGAATILGTVGAPALAVAAAAGVATVAVTWIADVVTKEFVSEDLTFKEMISDGVVNVVEGAVDTVTSWFDELFA